MYWFHYWIKNRLDLYKVPLLDILRLYWNIVDYWLNSCYGRPARYCRASLAILAELFASSYRSWLALAPFFRNAAYFARYWAANNWNDEFLLGFERDILKPSLIFLSKLALILRALNGASFIHVCKWRLFFDFANLGRLSTILLQWL